MKKLLGALYDDIFAYGDVLEIRLVLGRPIHVITLGRTVCLERQCTAEDLQNILAVATDYSVYTAVDRMRQGFLPYRGGVRIGIAAHFTVKDAAIGSVQRPTGLVVRLPRAVHGCSDGLDMSKVFGHSVLVVSPPFGGKTTFLRDLAARLSRRCNVVLVDEREELSGGGVLDTADCMVVADAPKRLVAGGILRALNPHYVAMDELDPAVDLAVVQSLVCGGVKVLATVHGDRATLEDERYRSLFGVCVLLSPTPTPGRVVEVYYA